MAMTEAQVTALELERVIPKIRTLFDRDDKFFSTIEKRDVEKISNRQMRIPLEIRPGGAFQYFNANGGDLGRGGGPTFDKAVLTCVFMSENIEYTKLVQWSTDDARKAIVNSVRRLTATAFDELRRQLDGQMMQDGSGVIGIAGASTTTTVIDLTTFENGARLIRVGQTVQVFTSAAVLRGSAVVSIVDVVAKTVTLETAVAGLTSTDLIVVNGITTPTFAAAQALFGVPYHDNNGSTPGTFWLGFDRGSFPEIRASRVNAASAALTLPLPRLAINNIGNRIGIDNDFNPDAWMHPAQQQAYEEIGQLAIIINKQAREEGLNEYFNGDNMQMAGAKVRTSYNWSTKRIDFISKEVWGRGEILPLGFYTTDGRKIFELRGASGGVATADIFYLVLGTQTFVGNPAGCSYIDNLAVPSGY